MNRSCLQSSFPELLYRTAPAPACLGLSSALSPLHFKHTTLDLQTRTAAGISLALPRGCDGARPALQFTQMSAAARRPSSSHHVLAHFLHRLLGLAGPLEPAWQYARLSSVRYTASQPGRCSRCHPQSFRGLQDQCAQRSRSDHDSRMRWSRYELLQLSDDSGNVSECLDCHRSSAHRLQRLPRVSCEEPDGEVLGLE